MNELNIYAHFNFKKVVKKANLYFNKKYLWYNPKTVFAPESGTYSVSIRRGNIRICYWDEQSYNGKQSIQLLKNFVKANFDDDIIGITFIGSNNIINDIKSINKIPIQ